MSVHLYLAPAVAGKTTYVLNLVRDAARGLHAIPRVVVPTHLQARAWRRRLGETGGAVGVRVTTSNRLYSESLSASCEVHTQLSSPVQHGSIHALAKNLDLDCYRS